MHVHHASIIRLIKVFRIFITGNVMAIRIVSVALMCIIMGMKFGCRKPGCNDRQQQRRQDYSTFPSEFYRLSGHLLRQ